MITVNKLVPKLQESKYMQKVLIGESDEEVKGEQALANQVNALKVIMEAYATTELNSEQRFALIMTIRRLLSMQLDPMIVKVNQQTKIIDFINQVIEDLENR